MGLREWVITHSFKSLPLSLRLAVVYRLESGQVQILLATKVSSQGLDIPGVDLVVNYDFTYRVYF